ncbi:MAG: tetratricopeptide repeat protein [Methanothrix sp.]
MNKDLDKYNESLEAFDKAAEHIPADDNNNLALAWEGKALALTQKGNLLKDMDRQEEAKEMYEEAVLHCDRAIELDPNFTGQEARLTKAGILSELGRYNESLAAYDEAILSLPADFAIFTATIMADKGSVLVKVGKQEEALKTFDGALQIDATSVVAWKGKGDALNETGRYVEAVNAYDKAITLSPEIGLLKAYAWQGKGNALKALGRQAEAVAAFAKAKELGYNA